jgi:hypothetical protein
MAAVALTRAGVQGVTRVTPGRRVEGWCRVEGWLCGAAPRWAVVKGGEARDPGGEEEGGGGRRVRQQVCRRTWSVM